MIYLAVVDCRLLRTREVLYRQFEILTLSSKDFSMFRGLGIHLKAGGPLSGFFSRLACLRGFMLLRSCIGLVQY
jgi:hypothetical protein